MEEVSYAQRALLLLLLLGCEAELHHGLSEQRVNQAILVLREAGIQADKRLERGGERRARFALTVPRGDETLALRLLAERGLPRGEGPGGAADAGLLMLPMEQHRLAVREREAELSRTLESLPQVQEAQVHLALPVDDPLERQREGRPAPTASVLLHLRGGLTVRREEIAALVARAVPGLSDKDVAVVSTPVMAQGAARPMHGLVRVGPVWVAASSYRMFNLLLACGFLIISLLLFLLIWPRLRRRVPIPEGEAMAGGGAR